MKLWALDEPAPELDVLTVGAGPGSRFELLNRLATGMDDSHWLVIADDDIRFPVPAPFRTLLAVAAREKFDISQPAHGRGSWRSHLITRQDVLLSVRETTFVEIGPVVAFSPRARQLAVPFPEEGMGWGVEVEWASLRSQGLRLGVLDCVPLIHLSPTGGYDMTFEMASLNQRVAAHGLTSFGEAQNTLTRQRFA